jgi:hypothetical protein
MFAGTGAQRRRRENKSEFMHHPAGRDAPRVV